MVSLKYYYGSFFTIAITFVLILAFSSLLVSQSDKASGIGEQIWETDIPGETSGAPVIFGDSLYVGGEDVYGLNLSSGEIRWTYKTDAPVVQTLTVNKKYVIAKTRNGRVHAIHRKNGKKAWTRKTKGTGTRARRPVIVDGKVYISGKRRMYCMRADDGTVLWKAGGGPGLYLRTTSVYRNVVLVVAGGKKLLAYNRTTGRKLWTKTTEERIRFTPVFVREGILIVVNRVMYCLKFQKGTIKWKYQHPEPFSTPPSVRGNAVFIGTEDGKLHVISRNRGKRIDVIDTTGNTRGKPIHVDDRTYLVTKNNKLHCLDAETRKSLWSRDVGEEVTEGPVYGNGIVVVGKDVLKAFRAKETPDNKNWPAYGGNPARNGQPMESNNSEPKEDREDPEDGNGEDSSDAGASSDNESGDDK